MATPLQYSCLENPMDRGAWWAAVHGVAGSRTRLSDFSFTFHFHALEKEMATHSSVLAWRIPGMGEPGGLPSMGSHRVGHDWSDLAAAAGDNREEGCSQGRKEAKETGQQKAMKMLPSACCSHLGAALMGSGNPRIHRPEVSSWQNQWEATTRQLWLLLVVKF